MAAWFDSNSKSFKVIWLGSSISPSHNSPQPRHHLSLTLSLCPTLGLVTPLIPLIPLTARFRISPAHRSTQPPSLPEIARHWHSILSSIEKHPESPTSSRFHLHCSLTMAAPQRICESNPTPPVAPQVSVPPSKQRLRCSRPSHQLSLLSGCSDAIKT